MANPIKYTTSPEKDSIQAGNFAIGVNKGGYGPTEITGFYNGKTANSGGYTIYVDNSGRSPSVFLASSDAELISWANELGGTNITTIEDALNFFNVSTTMLCTNTDYPNIVTEKMNINLDAAFTPSYPRNGNGWNDLSGHGNAGELFNGAYYSDGAIISDGVDDGVIVQDAPSLSSDGSFTLDAWVWFNQHKDYGSLLVKGSGGNGSFFNYCFFFYSDSLVCGFGDGVNFYAAGIFTDPDVPINTWHHIVGVYDSNALTFYLNGILMQNVPIIATPYINNEPLNIIQADYPIDGKVASARFYSRALSRGEIVQNYYAGLQRFIPTDELVLYLDPNNTDKQVLPPTIAYDESGYNNNAELVNGVALSDEGQRSFLFDGQDDVAITEFKNLTPSTSWTVWVKRKKAINDYNMIMGMYLPYFAFRADGSIHFSNNIKS